MAKFVFPSFLTLVLLLLSTGFLVIVIEVLIGISGLKQKHIFLSPQKLWRRVGIECLLLLSAAFIYIHFDSRQTIRHTLDLLKSCEKVDIVNSYGDGEESQRDIIPVTDTETLEKLGNIVNNFCYIRDIIESGKYGTKDFVCIRIYQSPSQVTDIAFIGGDICISSDKNEKYTKIMKFHRYDKYLPWKVRELLNLKGGQPLKSQ